MVPEKYHFTGNWLLTQEIYFQEVQVINESYLDHREVLCSRGNGIGSTVITGGGGGKMCESS